jgi:peptidoglycan hydrolase CwlO-like protein
MKRKKLESYIEELETDVKEKRELLNDPINKNEYMNGYTKGYIYCLNLIIKELKRMIGILI